MPKLPLHFYDNFYRIGGLQQGVVMMCLGKAEFDGKTVEIHGPKSTADGVIRLREELKEETLDAFGREGEFITFGGFVRVIIDKVTRNGSAQFTVRRVQ